jgi:hypothetical protein
MARCHNPPAPANGVAAVRDELLDGLVVEGPSTRGASGFDQARRLMARDGYDAGTVARAVGYESASLSSREFRRLFGVTPVEVAEQARARLVDG